MSNCVLLQVSQHHARYGSGPAGSIVRVVVCSLMAMFLALSAESQVVGGTFAGTVTDPSGAAIQHASVLVHNDDTGTERWLETDSAGRYGAPSVPIGAYTVTVEASGFALQRRTGIPLAVGQSREVDIALSVEAAAQGLCCNNFGAVVCGSVDWLGSHPSSISLSKMSG